MEAVASGHPPVVPCVEVQLSVRRGARRSVLRSWFGRRRFPPRGGTDELPEVVAQLQVGSTRFWVEGRVA